MKLSVLLVFIIYIAHSVQCANILFFFALASYSHRISVWPLVTTLAERGHNVTFLSRYLPKDAHKHPKVHEFFPKGVDEAIKAATPFDEKVLFRKRVEGGRFHQGGGGVLLDMGVNTCKIWVAAKETQHLVETGNFDLVVIDGLFNDCGFGLAHKIKPNPKTILYSPSLIFSWWYDAFGVVPEASWISDTIVSFQAPLNFWQRAVTAVLMPLTYYAKVWFFYPRLEELLRETLKMPDMPPIAEMERNVSLVIMNSHFSEEHPRSLPPLFVNVGGLHIRDEKSAKQNVPADMQKFMDESGDEGFIYISFGSMAEMSTAPPAIQQLFMNAFKNTKCRFLWKWEVERPKELSANVFTAKWMPQQHILAHPKIKAFVTHGGMMSLSEALMNGVPVIMFPIFAEQDFNSMRFEAAGRGIRLEISTVTSSELADAFNEIRTNSVYKTNMRKTRELYIDRPQSAVDTAVWWTEYVLRHDDLSSLKPLSMNQTWYERRLLDVWAFIAGVLITTILLILYVFKKLLGCLFCRGRTQASPSKKTTAAKKVKKN